MDKQRENLGELYELYDNSSYNCSSYAVFTVVPYLRLTLSNLTGALGVMYLLGLGTKKNTDTAFEILKEASARGNVYAMGHLVCQYYRRKLYTKAAELAVK